MTRLERRLRVQQLLTQHWLTAGQLRQRFGISEKTALVWAREAGAVCRKDDRGWYEWHVEAKGGPILESNEAKVTSGRGKIGTPTTVSPAAGALTKPAELEPANHG